MMRRIIPRSFGPLVGAMLLASLALVAGGTPASALGSGFTAIRNVGSNMCLEPQGQSTGDGARIVQEPCVTTGLESLAQGWESIQVGTNHFRFKNQLSGFCFDAFDSAVNGGRLIQGQCVPISNEEFNTGQSLPAVTKIETRVHFTDNGYCVDVPGNQSIPGLAVQIYRCNGTPAQVWVIGF